MKFNLADFLQLDTKALLSVNGGSSCGGNSGTSTRPSYGSDGGSYGSHGGGGESSSSSYGGGSYGSHGGGGGHGGSDGGSCGRSSPSPSSGGTCGGFTPPSSPSNPSDSSVNAGGNSCGGTHSSHGCQIPNYSETEAEQPTYSNQRSFSDTYGREFGEHACAATSLLNEISEQYTAETGRALTREQINSAMDAAVNSGNVRRTDANVNSWEQAANAMAQAVGLEGTYTYIYGGSSGSARIYAIGDKESGEAIHFVNDVGNGHYYDPSTGQYGNVSDLHLATKGNLGKTRDLMYTPNR